MVMASTEDDISLLWLEPSADVNAAVDRLEANATEIGLGWKDGCVARVGGAADGPVEVGQFDGKGRPCACPFLLRCVTVAKVS